MDPILDGEVCARDILYLLDLGINTVWVDGLASTANHSPCMKHFRDAGIYVVVYLGSSPNEWIFRTQAWDRDIMARYIKVMQNLAGYSNLLGFIFGMSVITSPLVKAAIRDTREYLTSKGNQVYIGTGGTNRSEHVMRDMMNCGDRSSAIDFLVFEADAPCADVVRMQDEIQGIASRHADFSIPLFFKSHLCEDESRIAVGSLPFVYNPNITTVFSGAIFLDYAGSPESNRPGQYTTLLK